MTNNGLRNLSLAAKSVAHVLSVHPDGLQFPALLERVLATSTHGDKRAERDVRRSSIAMIKAGWIVIDRGHWSLSVEGANAIERYADPGDFILEASRRSLQGWLSVRTPLYLYGVQALETFFLEFRAIRRVGFRRFVGKTLNKEKWHDILPLQAPRRWAFPQLNVQSLEELIQELRRTATRYSEGGHAVYLPPESLRNSTFHELAEHYPSDAGLKIIKKPGGVDDSSYTFGFVPGDSRVHVKLIHRPKHLSLVACLLFCEGVGPRLYDFVELQCRDQLWTGYVIRHVSGRTPTLSECQSGIERLQNLEQRGLLKVLLPEGFSDPEFECPSCSSNALMGSNGSFNYVDFQNFLLTDYGTYLTTIAREATDSSHFGDRSRLRGGRYLYQSVPGVNLPGKRDVSHRVAVLRGLMDEAGVSVHNRLVLDIGCNIGMMMAQYLKMGAAWCHGWDRPQVTPHAERLLLALGCTRFSMTGGEIFPEQQLEDDLPEFLHQNLDGCILSYLAVRGHIGWLKALARVRWSVMIYEGHEAESESEFRQHIDKLKNIVDCTVIAFKYYLDGDSDHRPIALLKRNGAVVNAEE